MLQNNTKNNFVIKCTEYLQKEERLLKKCLKKNNVNKEIRILFTLNDEASKRYVQNKERIIKKLGLNFYIDTLLNGTKESINRWIKVNNNNNQVLGMIIQYPIITKNRNELINRINYKKDLDALNDFWMKKLIKEGYKKTNLIPPTTLALKYILDNHEFFKNLLHEKDLKKDSILKIINNDYSNLKVHIVGQSILIGKPIYFYLINQGYKKITKSNINTKLFLKKKMIKNADIIITTTGSQNAVDEEWFTNGQVIINFGNRYVNNQVYGDVNLNKLKKNIIYTSLFNSTGIATIAGLLRNIRICIERGKLWK